MSKWFGESLFIILLLSGSIIVLTSQFVKADSTSVVETALFPVPAPSYPVLPMSFNFSTIRIDGGTNIRIVFNASKPILFCCQDSYEFNMSNSTQWTNITSEWSNETSFLDTNFAIPFTDRWFFTFVNNDTGAPVDIYSIDVYRIDTYEILVQSDSQSYNMGAGALFTVTVTNNTDPIVGMNVSLQVFGPDGDAISNQNNLTNDYGNIVFDVLLPSEQGVFSCVAKTTIAGSSPIEASETFVVVSNSNLPSTFDNYDHLWHTINFTITLSAFDGNSNVTETYYRINYGPIQNVTANGQPQITMESANNTLEYWSIDQAGNEEVPKLLTGIELDKTPPTGSIMINGNLTYINS